MIIHNTKSTDTPNNNIAVCLAEIQANKDDARDYMDWAIRYARMPHAAENARANFERALKCVERNVRWNEKLRAYRASK